MRVHKINSPSGQPRKVCQALSICQFPVYIVFMEGNHPHSDQDAVTPELLHKWCSYSLCIKAQTVYKDKPSILESMNE